MCTSVAQRIRLTGRRSPIPVIKPSVETCAYSRTRSARSSVVPVLTGALWSLRPTTFITPGHTSNIPIDVEWRRLGTDQSPYTLLRYCGACSKQEASRPEKLHRQSDEKTCATLPT
eukprot:2002381-Prymnesium_polylepis.2